MTSSFGKGFASVSSPLPLLKKHLEIHKLADSLKAWAKHTAQALL